MGKNQETPRITLFAAASLDGYIAGHGGDMGWVLDKEEWYEACQNYDAIIMGSNTFAKIRPIRDVQLFVFMHERAKSETENVQFVNETPEKFIKKLDGKYQKLMLAGGGNLNGQFAEQGLIDEMILSIHPVILGAGVKLFGDFELKLDLVLTNSEKSPKGFQRNIYKI